MSCTDAVVSEKDIGDNCEGKEMPVIFLLDYNSQAKTQRYTPKLVFLKLLPHSSHRYTPSKGLGVVSVHHCMQ